MVTPSTNDRPTQVHEIDTPAGHPITDSQVATEYGPSSGSTPRRHIPIALDSGTEIKGRFRYRLVEQLGKGGFGSVFLAECLECDGTGDSPPAEVAIKFFHLSETGDQLNLLKRELSALLPLQHERIIRLYDWNLDSTPRFLVVEHHTAGSLMDTDIFNGQPLSEAEALVLLGDLLRALNAAHQASILHLDIKPGNVLRDRNGRYVLTDFGISQGAHVSHHIVETGVGSPGYQSPEQRECNRRWIGPRTDLWGAGATVWSAYTGLRLDLHLQLLQTNGQRSGYGLPRISDFRPCNAELENLIQSLLCMDPNLRPGGAAEALALLQEINAACGRETKDNPSLRVFHTGDPSIRSLVDGLMDPLWVSICSAPRPVLKYVQFHDREVLCCQGEEAYRTYILLKGAVTVERDGRPIAREIREGTFIGENAALTGRPRTATIRADGEVWAIMLNAAELEQFVMANPAVGIRLIKSLALRNRLNHETATLYGHDSSL